MAALGGEEPEGAPGQLIDGGLLLGRERHPGAGDGSRDRLLGRGLRAGRLALRSGDDLMLRLDEDACRPAVAAEGPQFGRLLDPAEEPVELGTGETALRGLGHRGAEGAAVDGGVLTVEKEGTLGVGELGDDLGERRMTVERWMG
jgi:hypothetical protein